MSVFNLLYRNSFEQSSKFDIFSSIFSSYFSFIVFLKTQVMLYYSSIQSDGINSLVKEAFNINKNISNENIYTWQFRFC
jgi:acid phosphatase family membrane protein YuiD